MRLADDVRRAVVYLGHGHGEHFVSRGTAFLLHHDEASYLVTAQHVAGKLGDAPFEIRINSKGGEAITITWDSEQDVHGWFPWFTHEDPTVDLAIMPFNIDLKTPGFDYLYLSSEMALDEKWAKSEDIGCGMFCYAVGLFHLMQGQKRNLPVVHTGHVALMPSKDELIPVRDWKNPADIVQVEGYLVEITNLAGLSGAPVFIRPEAEIHKIPFDRDGMMRDVVMPQATLFLLGVWQGSWTGPPDPAMAGRTKLTVPVGMGIVVPAERLSELLDAPEVVAARDHWKKAMDDGTAKMD
ncbi:MAG TPA: hypothetical protein VIT45_07950 [Allosphingosinicella sp.]